MAVNATTAITIPVERFIMLMLLQKMILKLKYDRGYIIKSWRDQMNGTLEY